LHKHTTQSSFGGITIYIKRFLNIWLSKNMSSGEIILQSLESFLTGRTPYKLDILLKQLGHRLSYLGKVRNEAPIITSQTKELTNLVN